MCSRAFRPLGLPIHVARVPAAPFSLLPSSLCLDHSHCLVLAPATVAALPSTRAIETRSLPFHSPLPIAALPSMSLPPKAPFPIATCSRSLISFAPFGRCNGKQTIEERDFRDRGKVTRVATSESGTRASFKTSVTRVADREEIPLLLDRARQSAGQYIESLEEHSGWLS